jgi:hypothetical protein
MSSRWVFIALAVSAVAQANGQGRVRIAPLPMKALTGDSKLDRELPKQFQVRLLGTDEVECPVSEKVEAFLQTRAGAACEKDTACLKTLAQNTASLYALAATVRLNGPATAFVVSAVLFRVDGQKREIAFEYQIRPEVMTVAAAGDEAIKELIVRLELAKLERVLPLAAVPVEARGPEVVASDEGAPWRLGGKVALGVGAGSAVIGLVVLSVGLGQSGSIKVVDGNVPLSRRSDEYTAFALQNTGGAMLGIGAVVAAAGAVIWLLAPEGAAQVSLAPTAHGGSVVLGGTW